MSLKPILLAGLIAVATLTSGWKHGIPLGCRCAESGCAPRFQPGGTKVMFDRLDVAGISHIWSTDLASTTGASTQITSGTFVDQSANWSVDGTKIVFQRNGNGIGFVVETSNPDGSGQVNLTAVGGAGADILPSWGPDGKIYFSVVVGAPSAPYFLPETAVFRMNADGTGRTMLVGPGTLTYVFNTAAHASPDGTKIAYECGPDSATGEPLQICVANIDGSSPTKITNTSGRLCADPHWSPANTIVANCSDESTYLRLFQMNSDGSGLTALTSSITEPVGAQDANYSSDGTHVVFEWDDGGQFGGNLNAPAAVWEMNANGSGVHPVSCQ